MSFDYPIEHNIPLPPRGSYAPYPFKELAPGDSFVVADLDKATQVRSAAGHYNRKANKRFVVHKTEDGLRVWRVY